MTFAGGNDMVNTTTIYADVETDVKDQAEIVLNSLGIPMSDAVDLFLKQVVLQRGIPFDMKLPLNKPIVVTELSKEQFDSEIQKGFDDINAGKVTSADDVRKEMKREYKI